MANDNELVIKINGDIKGYRKALKAASKETEDLQDTLNTIAKTGAIVFLGLAGAIAFSAARYAEFDNGIRGVKTLLDDSSFSVKTLEQGFQDLSKGAIQTLSEFPLTLQSINKSLFDIVSAGVPAAKSIKVLGSTSRLAVAGITSSAIATDAVTSALNAYGIEAEQSELVAAKFFTAQKFGKTTIAELSKFMGEAVSSAASFGISLDQLLASTAAATSGGIKTSQALTSLTAILANIAKPTEEAKDEADRLGVEFNSTAIRAQGLTGFLESLTKAEGFNAQSAEKLFGSTEALKVVFALTGSGAKKYKQTLDALADSQQVLTTFTEAYKVQNDSLKNQTIILKNNFDALAISVGSNFAPSIKLVAGTMTDFLGFIQKHPGLATLISKLLIVGTVASGLTAIVALGTIGWLKYRASMLAAAVATKGLKFAIKGLLGATGIGLLVAFLPEIIGVFQSVFGEATKIVERETKLQNQLIKDQRKVLKAERDGISKTEVIYLKNRLDKQRAFAEVDIRLSKKLIKGDNASLAEFRKNKDEEVEIIRDRFDKRLKAQLAALETTEKVEKAEKRSLDKKAQRLSDENELIKSHLEGIERQEIAFQKRQQDINQKERDNEALQGEKRRKLAVENIELLNKQLSADREKALIKREELEQKKSDLLLEGIADESEAAVRVEEIASEKEEKRKQREAKEESDRLKRIQNLKDENALIKVEQTELEAEEVALLQRRQDLRDEKRQAELLADGEEKKLILENNRLKNEQLIADEEEFFTKKQELKAEQAEIETAFQVELDALSEEQRKALQDRELEDLRKGIQTKEQIRSKAVKKELIARRKEQALFRADVEKNGKIIATLNSFFRSEEVKGSQQTINALVQLQRSKNSSLKAIGKAAALVQIGIDTAKGAIAAYTSLAGIPIVGPGLGIAAASAITLFGVERAADVTAAERGGFIQGSGGIDSQLVAASPREFMVPPQTADEVINAVADKRAIERDTEDTTEAEDSVPREIIIGLEDEAVDFFTVRQNEEEFLGTSNRIGVI